MSQKIIPRRWFCSTLHYFCNNYVPTDKPAQEIAQTLTVEVDADADADADNEDDTKDFVRSREYTTQQSSNAVCWCPTF